MVSQSGSVKFTITGMTADLTVVQETIIDTLNNSLNRSLQNKFNVQVLYQSALIEN